MDRIAAPQQIFETMQQISEIIEDNGPKDYYVYAVIRRRKIIYVGKGSGERCYVSCIKHYGDDLLFLGDGMSECEALAYERKWIRRLHPQDNIRHNTYQGKFAPLRGMSMSVLGWGSYE